MANFTVRTRLALVVAPVVLTLSACEDAPRFAKDACISTPTPECLLYFAHQAALDLDGSKGDWRLFLVAKRQFLIGDETGALATVEDIESLERRIDSYLYFSAARAQNGDLDSAASFLQFLGDPALLNCSQRRRYARVQALTGDLKGALASLDVALRQDEKWRSELLQRADRSPEEVDPEEDWNSCGDPKDLWFSESYRAAAKRSERLAAFVNDSTLHHIALGLAKNGRPRAALDFARRIRGPFQRARAYLKLFETFTHTGTRTDSNLAAHKALDAVRLSAPGFARVRLLTDAAEAMLQLDLVESAKDALEIAKRDATSAIGDAKRKFWAALAVAEIEGRLGRIQDAWKTIEMGLTTHPSSYLDHPDRHTFSQMVRLAGSERYRAADFAFSLLVRDPVKEGEILVSIADTARRMGQAQAAKSLLGMASREAERLPPHRADERSSVFTGLLRQYWHLGDSAAVKQTISRIFSSLSYFKRTELRDLAVQSYARTLLSLDEHEAARRMLRRLHRVVYPHSVAAISVLRDAGDLATLEKVVGQIEAPDHRLRALIWIHRGKAKAGSKADALHAVERELRAVVAEVLDLADPKDKSQHLENMAFYLTLETRTEPGSKPVN